MSDMLSENGNEITAETQKSVENVTNEFKSSSIAEQKQDEEEKQGRLIILKKYIFIPD